MSVSQRRVLVVEDQKLWREQFFGESLQELGFIVFPAATKDEALKLLENFEFDLAVIDINLTEVPGNIDGLILADYIDTKGFKIPIIAVSGSEDGLRALSERKHLVCTKIRKDAFDLDEFITQVKIATNLA